MRIPSLLLCSILLAACNKDKDGDGFTKKDGDCNDDDALIYPDAAEVLKDGVDQDCDGEDDIDADGDGYGDVEYGGEDCDDDNELAFPGAEESDCTDPTDYNCDGSVGYADVDEDGAAACEDCDDTDSSIQIPTWYIDYDGDGYGFDGPYNTETCEAPDGFVDNGEDCDDTSDLANPDGVEVCDELDNDCDGLVDAQDDDVLDAGTYFPDIDGDGYGDETKAALACEGISGYVDIGQDCNDADELVNPDAIEVCNDGVDNNCSESGSGLAADQCELVLDSADAYWLAVDADDSVGISLTAAGDLNSDGYDDLIIGGSRADGDGDGEDEGAAWIVYGPVSSGTMGSVEDADVVMVGNSSGDYFGYRVANLGDIDGDLLPDVGATASLVSDHPTLTRNSNGAAYLFMGDSLSGSTMTAADSDIWIYGDGNYDWLGSSLVGLGDLDDDGFDDFAVGSTGWDGPSNGTGQGGGVFIFYGSADVASSDSWDVTGADVVLTGDESNDRIGTSIAGVGDVNGDSYDDVLIGSKYVTGLATNSGAVYLGLGPVSGDGTVGSLDAVFYGGAADDQAGGAISAAGDVNGDGYDDFYVAATGDNTVGGSGTGSVFLVEGSATLDADVNGLDMDSVRAAQIYGSDSDDSIGGSIDGTGDFDGDGNNDLLIGATSASEQGTAYIVYGPISGQVDVHGDAARAVFYGTNVDDSAGSTVRFLGDMDGSGNSAIGIAAQDDNTVGTDAGGVYMMLSIGL